jgi:hypothetical protein
MSFLDIEYLETITDYDVPDEFIEPNNDMQQIECNNRILHRNVNIIHTPKRNTPALYIQTLFFSNDFKVLKYLYL